MKTIYTFLFLTTLTFANEKNTLDQTLYQNLIKGYQKAHSQKNTDLLALYFCQDQVIPDDFKRILNHLKKGFSKKIEKVYVSKIDKDWPMEYTMQGIKYKPNLKPEAQLVILFKKGQGTKETKLLIGTKENKKFFTIAAPVK